MRCAVTEPPSGDRRTRRCRSRPTRSATATAAAHALPAGPVGQSGAGGPRARATSRPSSRRCSPRRWSCARASAAARCRKLKALVASPGQPGAQGRPPRRRQRWWRRCCASDGVTAAGRGAGGARRRGRADPGAGAGRAGDGHARRQAASRGGQTKNELGCHPIAAAAAGPAPPGPRRLHREGLRHGLARAALPAELAHRGDRPSARRGRGRAASAAW